MKNEAGRVKCHCDHMTNFAVLFSASGPKRHDERNAMALSIISYVGCAISLVGLTLTLMTYALFRLVKVRCNVFCFSFLNIFVKLRTNKPCKAVNIASFMFHRLLRTLKTHRCSCHVDF